MLIDILNQGDFCPLAVTMLILLWIGRILADQSQQKVGLGLATVGFLAYGTYAVLVFSPRCAEDLLWIVLRSSIAFGGTLGLAWVVSPLLAVSYRIVVGHLLRTVGRWCMNLRGHAAEGQRRRQAELDRKRAQEEIERTAPDRERAQQAAEFAAQTRAQAQKRRDDARAAREVLFHLHAHALAKRFPQAIFDDFMRRYMGDEHSAEYVEERGRQLTDLILRHAQKVSSAGEGLTLTTALAEFQEQINQIQNSTLDEEWKVSLISELQEKFYERIRSSLENKP